MQKVLVLLILLVTVAVASAQTPKRKTIVFNGDKSCGRKNFQPATDESIVCESLVTPRGNVSVVTHDDISIAVGFVEDEHYIIVATQIKNTSEQPLDIDTDTWGAAHFESKEAFFAGKKPFLAESAIPSRDIVRGITSGVTLDDSADTFMASISTASEVKQVRLQDGTRVKRVVIVEDPQAQTIAGSRKDSRAQSAVNEKDKIRKNAMVQKWVAAHGDAKGLVYFRREKKAGLVMFSFTIGDTAYVFRLLRDKGDAPTTTVAKFTH
jgi:hypothetical protein